MRAWFASSIRADLSLAYNTERDAFQSFQSFKTFQSLCLLHRKASFKRFSRSNGSNPLFHLTRGRGGGQSRSLNDLNEAER